MKDAATGTAVIDNSGVTGASFIPGTALVQGHSYTWYVGAEGGLGLNGPIAWSGATTFSLAALAAPTPSGPSGFIAASSGYETPTFSWSSVPGAAHYYLYVVDTTAGGGAIINNADLTSASFLVMGPLQPGHSYTWYVGAEGGLGLDGPIAWSGATSFTLAS